MRWQPEQPWFGPGPRGKIRPISWPGYLILFGGIALIAGLITFGRGLPPLLVIALAVALTVAALATAAVTYGTPVRERPDMRTRH